MRLDLPARTRRVVRLALYAIGAMILLGFLFLWSGVYSVAASRGHWAVIEWLLTFAMRNSVKTHALGIEAPPLDNPDLVTLGAGHFHSGCAFCHGAPGVPISPIAQQHAAAAARSRDADAAVARPRAVLDRQARHQIHRHAGMGGAAARRRGLGGRRVPAPAAGARRRELPRPGARRLADRRRRADASSRRPRRASAAVGACARCHGAERDGTGAARWCRSCTASRPNFSTARLQAYADGRRASGIMQPVASDLAPRGDAIASRATTPACRRHRGRPRCCRMRLLPSSAGAALAEQGDPAAKIPACIGCHGARGAARPIPASPARMPPTWPTGCGSGRAGSRPAPTPKPSWRRSRAR